jgi:hypothetical protein
MARSKKIKEEVQEQEPQQEPQQGVINATDEELALGNAINTDTLEAFKDEEICSEQLNILITVYLSLKQDLGSDAPATIAAFGNLESFESATIKAKKPKKEPKEKAFNELRELRSALAAPIVEDEDDNMVSDMHTALSALLADDRVSEELKAAITTYNTIRGNADLPAAVTDYAFSTLELFGGKRKTSSGDRKPIQFQPPYEVEVNGERYSNLSDAIRSIGYDQKTLDDNGKPTAWNQAWSKCMAQLKKEGKAVWPVAGTEDNVTLVRHWLTDEEEVPTTEDESSEGE